MEFACFAKWWSDITRNMVTGSFLVWKYNQVFTITTFRVSTAEIGQMPYKSLSIWSLGSFWHGNEFGWFNGLRKWARTHIRHQISSVFFFYAWLSKRSYKIDEMKPATPSRAHAPGNLVNLKPWKYVVECTVCCHAFTKRTCNFYVKKLYFHVGTLRRADINVSEKDKFHHISTNWVTWV